MLKILEGSNQEKTNFLIEMFCESPSASLSASIPMEQEILAQKKLYFSNLYKMLSESIALAGFLHNREEKEISAFGYCLPEKPLDSNFKNYKSTDEDFLPLSQIKQQNGGNGDSSSEIKTEALSKETSCKKDEEEPLSVFSGGFPNQDLPQNSNSSTAPQQQNLRGYVVIDTNDKILNSEEEEQRLWKEIKKEEQQQKRRQEKLVLFENNLTASVVISIFKFNNIEILESTSVGKRDSLDLETLMGLDHVSLTLNQVASWANAVVPSFGYILSSLVKLNITAQLSENVPEIDKRMYRRVAPLPDPVNMSHSSIWSTTTAWIISNIFFESRLLFAKHSTSHISPDSGRLSSLDAAASWKLLYSSGWNGHSLSRLIHNVVGYKAETLFFIQTTKDQIFGAYLASPWDLSSSYFGNSSFFLFGLIPLLTIFHSLNRESSIGSFQTKGSTSKTPSNFAYCFNNPKSYTRRPVGIGFGGNYDGFRLSIDEDLLHGICVGYDTTYEPGMICPDTRFEIKLIEVWGASSDYAEASLQRERRLKEKDAERARKAVDRGQAWHENPDKFIMDLAGKTGSSDGYLEAIEKERRAAKEREELKMKLINKTNGTGK